MIDLNSAIRPCAIVKVCDKDKKLLQMVFKIEKEGNDLKFLPVNENAPHDKIWVPDFEHIDESVFSNTFFVVHYDINKTYDENESYSTHTKYISKYKWVNDRFIKDYDFIPIISLSALPRIEDYSFASEQDLSLVREVVGDRKDKRFLAIINERKVDGSSTLSVKTSHKLCGMFELDETNNVAKLNIPNHFISQGTKIYEIDYNKISDSPYIVKDSDSGQEYISNLKDFKRYLDSLGVKYKDRKYQSDIDLVSFWAKDLKNPDGKKTVLSKNEAKTLLAALRAFNEAKSNILDDESYSRLKNILENYINSDDNYKSKIKPLIEDFISQNKDFMDGSVQQVSNEELEGQIEKYKNENAELKIKCTNLNQKIKEFEKSNRDLTKVKSDIDKLREQALKEQENIDKKKQEFEKLEEKLNQQNFEKLEKEKRESLEKLDSEYSSKKKKYDELLVKLDIADNLDVIQHEIKKSKNEKERLEEQKADYIKAMQSAQDNLSEEVYKFEEIYDFVKKRVRVAGSSVSDEAINVSLYQDYNLKNVLQYLYKRFESKDYNIRYFQIVNILVCLVNNRFVIFSGSPGTGKTSTATMLADFLNLSSNSLFKKVSVARGWSSSRDFIGYYNPINNQFESAKTGIYEFLSTKYNEDDILQLILLDEANLSPIEHYWSDFLDTIDNDSCDIPLGNNQAISIKKGCKFIGTINSDHSTEVLTPRLIDRTPIISFTNNSELVDIKFVDDYKEFDLSSNTILGLSQLANYLSRDGSDSSSDNCDAVIREFNKSFKGYTSISIRKIEQIKIYISSFNAVIDSLGTDNNSDLKNQVVDYAIMQFILPLINFNCFDSKPLDDFLGYLKNSGIYERSISVLEDIIAKGKDNLGHYSFF
ncbi:hypothetical protein [Francisella tularensis]|uniref:hypothetical protein n=1 Tax=Francisella tularensis TaxID=263 RepID=UPI001C0E9495|nr:hypothetical protein [Francisella tularensis]MBK2109672.1 hypothetical protein [Francisella tularensis subsp. novicida FSC595]